MIYPNQRFIEIHKEIVSQTKSRGRYYLIEYTDNIIDACKALSASAFKVYIAIILNKSGYTIDYSPEYLRTITGLCRATAKKALVELEEKNFLVKRDDKHFDFFDYPHKPAKKNVVKEERRRIVDTYTGKVYMLTYNELRQHVSNQEADKLWQEGIVL